MKSKKTPAILIFFVILILAFFAGTKLGQTKTGTEVGSSEKRQNSGWNIYTKHGFSIEFPPEYLVSEGEDKEAVSFRFSDGGTGTFAGYIVKTELPGIEEYLVEADKKSETGYEGQPSKEVFESQKIKINGREAVLRKETWLAAGFTTNVAYIFSNRSVYVFALYPQSEVMTQSEEDIFLKFINSFKLIE